jgi:nitroimidazol reductase NimA-like FMN-containing flavoprotein (pyridoxamine 5'-phosphate oxidase superfamily)
MLVQEMTSAECLEMVAAGRLARLACAWDNQPYIIPTYYAFENPFIYGCASPGLKLEWMRANPRVCLEFDNVADTDRWMSVIVFGQYEELSVSIESVDHVHDRLRQQIAPQIHGDGSCGRAHAHELLQKQPEWWEPACAFITSRNRKSPVIPIFYRIQIDRISGRKATADSIGFDHSQANVADRKTAGWLRGVLDAWASRFGRRMPDSY